MHKLAMILCVMSVSLTAQWPTHPTPGMPRTPGGKPDLSAAAPAIREWQAGSVRSLAGKAVKLSDLRHLRPQAGRDPSLGRGAVQTARG